MGKQQASKCDHNISTGAEVGGGDPLKCRSGHSGPWRYVEQIEVWRTVSAVGPKGITVNPHWETGEGYNDGVDGTAYLLCWARENDGSRCVCSVEITAGTPVSWD
jgi:hypothetical protein